MENFAALENAFYSCYTGRHNLTEFEDKNCLTQEDKAKLLELYNQLGCIAYEIQHFADTHGKLINPDKNRFRKAFSTNF